MNIEEKNIAQFRDEMTDVFNRVHYTGAQFRVMRHSTPVARLVPEKFMSAIEQLLDDDSAIEETLELMLNPEFRQEIEQAVSEAEAGQGVAAEEFFKGGHGS